jgi:hypothetical protein
MTRYLALLAVALGACTNGQGEVDVTSSHVASFPGAHLGARGLQLSSETQTSDAQVTLDLKKDLDSLSQLGTLTGTVSKNTVSGPDLSRIQHIKVTIATDDGKIREQTLSDMDVPKSSSEIELPLLISSSQVIEYLTEGKVDLHIYLTGNISEQPLTLTHTLVAHMDVAVKGSVLKL